MVHKRDPSTPTGAADRPPMPKEVTPAELHRSRQSRPQSATRTGRAGGSAYFEDYEPGEKIDHVDGMTIEESEHAIATRLYQNTAKVHFDAVQTKDTRFGRRLMYGGHVISIARSLSFNGMEKVLGILAWNGGAHANPTFAGDTIYAYSEILDKADLPGRSDCGALRVQIGRAARTFAPPKLDSRSRFPRTAGRSTTRRSSSTSTTGCWSSPKGDFNRLTRAASTACDRSWPSPTCRPSGVIHVLEHRQQRPIP